MRKQRLVFNRGGAKSTTKNTFALARSPEKRVRDRAEKRGGK